MFTTVNYRTKGCLVVLHDVAASVVVFAWEQKITTSRNQNEEEDGLHTVVWRNRGTVTVMFLWLFVNKLLSWYIDKSGD